jgi:hypothetical protein
VLLRLNLGWLSDRPTACWDEAANGRIFLGPYITVDIWDGMGWVIPVLPSKVWRTSIGRVRRSFRTLAYQDLRLPDGVRKGSKLRPVTRPRMAAVGQKRRGVTSWIPGPRSRRSVFRHFKRATNFDAKISDRLPSLLWSSSIYIALIFFVLR